MAMDFSAGVDLFLLACQVREARDSSSSFNPYSGFPWWVWLVVPCPLLLSRSSWHVIICYVIVQCTNVGFIWKEWLRVEESRTENKSLRSHSNGPMYWMVYQRIFQFSISWWSRDVAQLLRSTSRKYIFITTAIYQSIFNGFRKCCSWINFVFDLTHILSLRSSDFEWITKWICTINLSRFFFLLFACLRRELVDHFVFWNMRQFQSKVTNVVHVARLWRCWCAPPTATLSSWARSWRSSSWSTSCRWRCRPTWTSPLPARLSRPTLPPVSRRLATAGRRGLRSPSRRSSSTCLKVKSRLQLALG